MRIDAGADFQGAAVDFLATQFQMSNPQFGPVYGLHQSQLGSNWEFDRVTASRVFIVHVTDKESHKIGQSSSSHVRWSLENLRRRRREVSPEGVVLLATRYIEGWIPDGPITLH
ncbi:hypothetical protein [Streptomyces cyaneofuscatus]|uniref:hypothetical protein n=1 Tax=Streptomyces cyaneofuscatus TaxID=66883 RepID=UPI00379E5E1A